MRSLQVLSKDAQYNCRQYRAKFYGFHACVVCVGFTLQRILPIIAMDGLNLQLHWQLQNQATLQSFEYKHVEPWL
jgi:hypothetical protein